MKVNPLPVATQIQQIIDLQSDGETPDELPTARSVCDARTSSRTSTYGPGEATGSQWKAAIEGWSPKPEDPPWAVRADLQHSSFDELTTVLKSQYLTSLCSDFANKHGPDYKFCLCCDATHDKGIQKSKLISMGWLGGDIASPRTLLSSAQMS